MQLTVFGFMIITSILGSIVSTKSNRDHTNISNAMNEFINETNFDESTTSKSIRKKLYSIDSENCKYRRFDDNPFGQRRSRMTHVKAILSNPKISADQQLAQKLALAELKSPKMREIMKKLTIVHSPRKKRRHSVDPEATSSSALDDGPKFYFDSRKALRSGTTRRRVKKRRKIHGTKHKRAINSRLGPMRRAPEVRDTQNKNRYDESIGTNEYSDERGNDDDIEKYPYANEVVKNNYPEIKNYDVNYKNFENNENSLDRLSSEDRNDDKGYGYSSNDDFRDLGITNDRSPIDRFSSVVDDHRSTNSRDRSIERNYDIRNRGDSSSMTNLGHHLHRSKYKNIPNQRNYDKFGSRNIDLRDYDNYDGRFSKFDDSLDSNYRSMNPNEDPRRLVVRNENFVDPMNVSSLNSTENTIDESTTTTISVEYSKRKIKGVSRNQKSDRSIEKSVTGSNETSTTLLSNSSTSETSETSSVTPKTVEKTIRDSKSSRGIELHSLATNKNDEYDTEVSRSTNDERINGTAMANATKEVAGQILNKIIEELEDLKLERTKTDPKEGLPCRLSGSWVTTRAGVRIDMSVTNRRVNVTMAKLNSPGGIVRPGLLNYTWNVTGQAPFRRGGPFSLMAIDNHTKSLAVFVGSCRVCQGIDTIEGVWSIAREPRDCRDFQVATSMHNDIFRRTKLLSAIRDRQMSLAKTTKYPTTTFASAIKRDRSSTASNDSKVV